MTIEINSPSDSFNLIEVLEFRYTATPKQISDKKLYIKCKRYKDNGDGTYSYSDELPFDLWVNDVDSHIYSKALSGSTIPQDALYKCMGFVTEYINDRTSFDVSLV